MEGKQLQGNSQAPVISPLEEVSNSKACHNGDTKKQNEIAGEEAKPFDEPKWKKYIKPKNQNETSGKEA